MSDYETDPVDAMDWHMHKQQERIADLERQLAETKAILAKNDPVMFKAMAEDDEERARLRAEIDALQPLAEWARHHPQFPRQYPGAPSITRKPG